MTPRDADHRDLKLAHGGERMTDYRGGSGAGSLGGAQQLTGGGVVAEMFRDLQKPSRFSGGGGSSRDFP